VLGAVLAGMLVAWHPCASALDPSRRISQYGHHMWRIQDGFLPGPPEDITQTKDGYLWIGTDAGLVRFDGVRFVPWVSSNGEQLPSYQIFAVLGASDGSLWVGTAKGLARWKAGKLTTYKALQNRIWHIVEDHDGSVWIVRSRIEDRGGPLCRVTEGEVRCFGEDDGIPLPTATGLELDPSGNFWISGNQGLCRWKPGFPAKHFFKGLADSGYLMGVDALSVQSESHVWIGLQQPNGNLQLEELEQGGWKKHPLPKLQGAPPSTNVLFRDPEGTLWVGTASDGIYRMVGNKIDHFSNTDGLSSDSIERFFQDREGILWVASTKGIDNFRELPVVSYSIKEGLASDSVSSIVTSHDGGVWIGGAEALGYLKQDKLTNIRTNHGLPGRDITTMLEDRQGRLWIGVDDAMFVLDHGHFLPIRKPDGTSVGIAFGIAEDTDGNKWLVTETSGLLRVENLTVRQQVKLSGRSVAIAADPKAGVWLGFPNGDLAHYSKNGTQRFPADPAVSTANVRQLLPEPGVGFWAVAEDALILWDRNDSHRAALTTRNGLPCNELYSAVKDAAGALWLYSRCGLFSVPASQLELWREDHSNHVKVEMLDLYDGVQPGITDLQPQATRSLDGRLWFANNNIVQTFDPRAWRKNTLPPNVMVERVEADGVNYPVQLDFRLPPLIRNLQIDFTAPSFPVPQKVLFRYKLDGHDSQWQGSEGRRSAFYGDLRPGAYTFHVMACSNDGVWNAAGAAWSFEIAPAFYQTAWFLALCIAVACLALYVLYLLWSRQVARRVRVRMEVRLAERERIARELHDTLLQSVQGLILKFHAIAKRMPATESAHLEIEKTLDYADQVLAEGRDRVKSLRASTIGFGELPKAFQQVVEEVAPKRSSMFKTVVEGTVLELHPIIREETYCIGREALINALAHSDAQNIEAEITYNSREFRLRIRDDGHGIDPAVLEKGEREGHWGLQGMRERAKKIGAKLELWSRPGSGTEVELTVPAAMAYRSPRGKPTDSRSRVSAAG
jgi:ligand-binding sensor domain-containing protein